MNLSADSTPTAQNSTPDVGELGEMLVARWLQTQAWVVLHHRWRCRRGEIDLIAQLPPELRQAQHRKPKTNVSPSPPASRPSPLLAFIEVKTRSRGNWDADGLLAITPSKQAKLWRTAELFLGSRPDLAELPCRFDVALVSCRRVSGQRDRPIINTVDQLPAVQLGQPVCVAGYQLILQDYIPSAFG